jgi:hypothetical protein
MIVLWSAHSIESEWVCEEASEGRRLGKLVPVLIEDVRPPAGFREIQAADLTDWDGTREFEGLRMLLADLESMLGKPGTAVKDHPARPADRGQTPYDPTDLPAGRTDTDWWPRHRLAVMAAAGLLLLAAGAAYIGLATQEPAALARPVPEPERPERRASSLPAEATPTPGPAAPVAATPAPVEAAPRPVAAEASPPPVAKLAPKARPPVRPAETSRATGARCADLLSRIQLGESLSYEAQAIFQKECQQ